MAKVKGLSQADLQLWAAYSQTLKLLPGRTRLPIEPEPLSTAASAEQPAIPAQKIKAKPQGKQIEVGAPPPGLDKSSWQKFRSGESRAARILDLHGMTAARAHHATLQFIVTAHAQQLRVVEIISG
jgi:DNA-nicking Smr family endonuclease